MDFHRSSSCRLLPEDLIDGGTEKSSVSKTVNQLVRCREENEIRIRDVSQRLAGTVQAPRPWVAIVFIHT